MSIDGIGRPPIPPSGAGSLGGPSAPEATSRTFEVGATEASAEVGEATLLSKLEGGELTLEQYLDARVEVAVAPFTDRLSPEQLAFVRESLKVELTSDPVLVELVRRTAQTTSAATDR